VGDFSDFGALKGFGTNPSLARVTSGSRYGQKRLAYVAGDRRAACGVLRNALTDNLPVLRA
jgi:hypothetical protein